MAIFIKIGKDYYHYHNDLFLKTIERVLPKDTRCQNIIIQTVDIDPSLGCYIVNIMLKAMLVNSKDSYLFDMDINYLIAHSCFKLLKIDQYLLFLDVIIKYKLYQLLPKFFINLYAIDNKLCLQLMSKVYQIDLNTSTSLDQTMTILVDKIDDSLVHLVLPWFKANIIVNKNLIIVFNRKLVLNSKANLDDRVEGVNILISNNALDINIKVEAELASYINYLKIATSKSTVAEICVAKYRLIELAQTNKVFNKYQDVVDPLPCIVNQYTTKIDGVNVIDSNCKSITMDSITHNAIVY